MRSVPVDEDGISGRHHLAYYLWFDWQEYPATEYWIGIKFDMDEVTPVIDPAMYPNDSIFNGRLYYIYPSERLWLSPERSVTCGRTDNPIPFATCPPGR